MIESRFARFALEFHPVIQKKQPRNMRNKAKQAKQKKMAIIYLLSPRLGLSLKATDLSNRGWSAATPSDSMQTLTLAEGEHLDIFCCCKVLAFSEVFSAATYRRCR